MKGHNEMTTFTTQDRQDAQRPTYAVITKSLTDEQIEQIYREVKADSLSEHTFPYRFAVAIELAHGIGEPLQPNSGLGGVALKSSPAPSSAPTE